MESEILFRENVTSYGPKVMENPLLTTRKTEEKEVYFLFLHTQMIKINNSIRAILILL